METSQIIKTTVITILSVTGMIALSTPCNGQTVTYSYLTDKSKVYQLRSMENGKWEFHPGIFYMVGHKKYSGGYWKGLNIRWSVNKSDCGQVMPWREKELGIEAIIASDTKKEEDTINPLMKEETVRSAERMADAAYILYSDKFKEYLDNIEELAEGIRIKSNGAEIETVDRILDEKELLEEEIDYIHKMGPSYQMEQAKRELAYEKVLDKLASLNGACAKGYYYILTKYKSK